jgi:hypothetical protein
VSAFKVVRRRPVVVYEERVLLETDDWREAERAAMRYRPNVVQRDLPEVRGTHPSHNFDPAKLGASDVCRNEGCGSHNNGSYGSHAPCGFDFGGRSLLQVLEEDPR